MKNRIFLLADINSSHTRKWAEGLIELNYSVAIFTLNDFVSDWPSKNNVQIFHNNNSTRELSLKSDMRKSGYLFALKSLKKAIRMFMPDVVHAHYATSYGFLGALSGFHPFIISVWGSDILDFPLRSFFHRKLIKYNFKNADLIISTGSFLAGRTGEYTHKKIEIIPFGIDIQQFEPETRAIVDVINIGTVKSLEDYYGIDILIRAYSKLIHHFPGQKFSLKIAGSGSKKDELIKLAESLGLKPDIFTGKISQDHVPAFLNSLDIFVCPSRRESFGVSVLEASACGLPVIVSDIEGLKEVFINNVSGINFKSGDADDLLKSLSELTQDFQLRKKLGMNGRKYVEDNFDWNKNLNHINDIYHRF